MLNDIIKLFHYHILTYERQMSKYTYIIYKAIIPAANHYNQIKSIAKCYKVLKNYRKRLLISNIFAI